MTRHKQLGSLFMVGLPGTVIDPSTLQLISGLGINHFIIFRRNVESPAQLQQLCARLKAVCREHALPSPLISIDQEGGSVARLPDPFSQFDDARVLAESSDPLGALSAYAATCAKELREIGINMNMAPVLDVCPAGEGFFMERRSLGNDPDLVGKYGCHIISGLQSRGIAACAKHFPGLGAAKLDPHLQLPTVSRAQAQIEAIDLIPFQQAISADVASIMTSHTIYEDIDSTIPATMSAHILNDILRRKLGYKGMIITDDLEMGAIENERSVAQATVQAFSAGVDMLLICHDHEKVRHSYAELTKAIDDEQLLQKRYEESLGRVTAVQRKFAK